MQCTVIVNTNGIQGCTKVYQEGITSTSKVRTVRSVQSVWLHQGCQGNQGCTVSTVASVREVHCDKGSKGAHCRKCTTKGALKQGYQEYCRKSKTRGVVARGQFAAPATEESKMSAKQDCCHGSDKRFQDLKSKCCQQIQNPNKRI